MYAKMRTCSLNGLEGVPVEVEAEILRGMSAFYIVGLPSTEILESKERIRSTLKNLKVKLPVSRIVVNLAPADDRKNGSHFDLPIAMTLLAAMHEIPPDALHQISAIGELSLDGRVLPVRGSLRMILHLRSEGIRSIVIPKDNLAECAVVPGVRLLPIANISEFISYCQRARMHSQYEEDPDGEDLWVQGSFANMTNIPAISIAQQMDYREVKNQPLLKRALLIAAAGGHNLLMIGPPGCGKTMSALRFPGILPPMNEEEILEVTGIASVAGELETGQICQTRPFREVHHSITVAGMIGGGNPPWPGEITKAHRGVLYLDELTEFSRHVLENLRTPMERKSISIARGNRQVVFPSAFQLIASMNPCPCGHHGDPIKDCTCTHPEIRRYLSKISKPLLDRIDMIVEVAPSLQTVTFQAKGEDAPFEESTISMLEQVIHAQRQIRHRDKQSLDMRKYLQSENEGQKGKAIDTIQTEEGDFGSDKCLFIDSQCKKVLQQIKKAYKLSNRGDVKVLKLASTIAALNGRVDIIPDDIVEASQYRVAVTKYWGV